MVLKKIFVDYVHIYLYIATDIMTNKCTYNTINRCTNNYIEYITSVSYFSTFKNYNLIIIVFASSNILVLIIIFKTKTNLLVLLLILLNYVKLQN